MLVLAPNSVLEAAVTASNIVIPYYITWVDTTDDAVGVGNGTISSSSPTTLVSGPTSGHRIIRYVSLYNLSGSAADILVLYNSYRLFLRTIAQHSILIFDGGTWYVNTPYSTIEVTRDGIETLTNKTLTNPALTGQTLTDAEPTTWDWRLGNMAIWSPAGNRTLNWLYYPAWGSGALVIIHNGVTITWPSGIRWAGGSPPTLSTGTGKRDVITFNIFNNTIYAVASLNH